MLRLVVAKLVEKRNITSEKLNKILTRIEEIDEILESYKIYKKEEKEYLSSKDLLKLITSILVVMAGVAGIIDLIGFFTDLLSTFDLVLIPTTFGVAIGPVELYAITKFLIEKSSFKKMSSTLENSEFSEYDIDELKEELESLKERKAVLEEKNKHQSEQISTINNYLRIYGEVKKENPDIFDEYQEYVSKLESLYNKEQEKRYKLN